MSIHYSSSQHRHHTPYGASPAPPPRPVSSAYGGGYGDPAYSGGAPVYSGGAYGGAYGGPPGPAGPPAGADPQLWQWFNAVDSDRSGAITVKELQAALVNGLLLLHQSLLFVFSLSNSDGTGNWSSEKGILFNVATIIHFILLIEIKDLTSIPSRC